MTTFSPSEAARIIIETTPRASAAINRFSQEILKTRGGRLGSGMGTLLEALWGYYTNRELDEITFQEKQLELVWLIGHEYNDFACVERDGEWLPEDRTGELLRIEAKSMNLGADESKGHFDELVENLGEWDLLLALVWNWKPADNLRIHPYLQDYFIGSAKPIARFRDALHIARGGSFVDRANCPDGCDPEQCTHHGEPLNAAGKRERISGPNSRRPATASYAANFGGLVRMLKTGSDEARSVFRKYRYEDDVVHQYVSFVHRNLPNEELNQYVSSEWRKLASTLGIGSKGLSKEALVDEIRLRSPGYQDKLRALFLA